MSLLLPGAIWLIKGPAKTAQKYETINAAVLSAVSGDFISVGPGFYPESFTIPDGVSVQGASGPERTIITGSAPTGARITMGEVSLLRGVSVVSPTDASPAILDATVSRSEIQDILLVGVSPICFGLRKTGPSLANYRDVFYIGGDADAVFEVNAGDAIFWNSYVMPPAGAVGVAFRCLGGTTRFFSAGTSCPTVVKGLEIGGTAKIIGGNLEISNTTTAIHVLTDTTNTSLRSVYIEDSSSFDLLVDPAAAAAVFDISSGELNGSKVSRPAPTPNLFLAFLDTFDVDRGLVSYGQFSVGTHLNPKESVFGGGDSHVRGESCKSNTFEESGTWLDITTILTSTSGSTTAIFNALTVGASFYVGGDLPFPGLKTDVVASIVLGGGALVCEHWNGAAWVSHSTMCTDANGAPQGQYANTPFQRVQNDQNRWFSANFTWATKTLDGETKFWIRYRVITAPITTSPVLELVKLHTNRFEINAGGNAEQFGDGESLENVIWHRNLVDDLSGASPANATIAFSANSVVAPGISITTTGIDNQFNNGALDGIGGTVQIPDGLDTSRPVTFRVLWYPDTVNGGDVELQTMNVALGATDLIGAGVIVPNDQSEITTIPAANRYVRQITTFDFDVSDLVPGDDLAIALLRDARAGNVDDTLAGNIKIYDMDIVGTYWR